MTRLSLTATAQPKTGSASPLNLTSLLNATTLGANTGVSFTNTGREVLHVQLGQLTSPTAPSVSTATTGGTVAAGTYQVEVSYTNTAGETVASASASVTTTGSTSTITVTSPAAAGNATGWYAYVTQASGASYTRQQTAGSPTAIGTNLTLTAPPTNTGLAPQSSNSSAGSSTVIVNIGTTIEGQPVSAITASLATNATNVVGPFPTDENQPGGLIFVDFGTPASVTGVALLQNSGVF
ncbi:hypothetical protein ACFXDE_02135 [Kitasatospora sp. NPDC059408]|uniref:hypothetical protein n=1 Tax=Kitasatospora sp. NPDC059408 TaxID=3346823 RepID=UPI00369BC59A